MKNLIIASICLLVLSACSSNSVIPLSMTLPVTGKTQTSNEIFNGVATGYLDGSGVVNIVSDEGVSCEGRFIYVTQRQGEGVFYCDDNRSGPFDFVSTGNRGTGKGELDGEIFTFTFGH